MGMGWRHLWLWIKQAAARLNWQTKIRNKFFLLVLLWVALPLTIFAAIALRMGTSYVYLDNARQNQDKALRIAKQIDEHFSNQTYQLYLAISSFKPDELYEPSTREEMFRHILKETPELLAVVVTNFAGKVSSLHVRDPGWSARLLKIRHLPHHFFSPKELGYELGDPRYSPEFGQQVLPVSFLLPYEQNARSDQVVLAYLGLEPFWKQVAAVNETADSVLFLVDPHGDLLFYSAHDTSDHKLAPASQELAQRLSDAAGYPALGVEPYANARGNKVFGAFGRCPSLKWGVVLEQRALSIAYRVTRLRLAIFAFWAGTLLISLIAGIWFVGRLVRPIEDLEAGIKLVSSGMMGDELPLRSSDEIGRLTQTFNQMTRTLVQRNEEIRTKTRELTFFNTITRIINQSVDLKTILDHSLQKILQLMRATAGLSYVYQPAVRQFKLISHFGVSDQFVQLSAVLDVDQGLLAKTFSSGEPLMIRDVSRHSEAQAFVRQELVRDLLFVPLRSKKRTLGVLTVGSRRRHYFHYRDLDLLARIGDEIGVNVENALLYAELQLKIKELEAANRELQELDHLKNQFLSNVSHELRTPITTIKTYVELFLNGKIGAVDEPQKEKLAIVRRNVNNLLSLINDILTLTRMDSQDSRVEPLEAVSLPELVDQVVADTVEMARAKGLHLARTGLAEVVFVRVNRQRIRQVLQNLIANAIKFTERGSIAVALRRGVFAPGADGGDRESNSVERVEISVTDTGIGIPPAELGKLFQRFYQVDSSSTRKYVGTGLGLAIVKEILSAHHSEIQVSSEVGRGSRFWFTLPLADAKAPSEF